MRRLPLLLSAVCLVLAGVLPAGAQSLAVTSPQVLSVLPPGNSAHVTVAGQVEGMATGDPDAYGPNVDDQRELYWEFAFKDGALRPAPTCPDPQTPRAGVTVCFDGFGVPAVYADDPADLWFGAGYAIAQLRLFEIDAIRRTARGTLAELTGPSGVPEDVATRVQTYTEDELQAQLDRQPASDRLAVQAYVEGVNAWIGEVTTTRVDQLPAEYVLLTAAPEPLTATDVASMGVLMTRFVAAEGRHEMTAVRGLRRLEEALGQDAGRAAFLDLLWQEDTEAAVTIPRSEGVFPRTSQSAAERRAAFEAMADLAATIPLELAAGPGTGAYPEPTPGPGGVAPPPVPAPREGALVLPGPTPGVPAAVDPAVRAAATLEAWRAALDGGSFLVAIGPQRTADGSALLVSEPQLDQNPQLLVELEVHGAGYHARGTTVPGLPVVGIGYNDRVAWALTTGNSKTIDSFVETTRPDSDGDGVPEYLHDGVWKPQECRDEVVHYRAAPQGVPSGPAVFTVTVPVCRTVHGPIVAAAEDGTVARSTQYAMWGREVDTVQGVLAWNRARNLDDFAAAMRKVTWNENTGYADADGNIAYWHPGLHPVRHRGTDLRLPIPGTGEFDHDGFLPFGRLPQVVNPRQGFVANWNNKPAHGWLDHGGLGSGSYPAGPGNRVNNLLRQLEARDDWTFEALRELDRYAGTYDTRAAHFLPLLLALRSGSDLSTTERAALGLLAAWDGSATGEGAELEFAGYASGEVATVGAAATLFDDTVDLLVEDVVEDLRAAAPELVDALAGKGRHVWDMGPLENLALRAVQPSSSSLGLSRDYLDGRSATEVILDAFRAAVTTLAAEQGEEPSGWRGPVDRMEEVCSATGVVGPCGTMPFLERGAWIHLVGYPAPPGSAPHTGTADGGDASAGPLPTTGGGVGVLGLLVVALGCLAVGSRRGAGTWRTTRT